MIPALPAPMPGGINSWLLFPPCVDKVYAGTLACIPPGSVSPYWNRVGKTTVLLSKPNQCSKAYSVTRQTQDSEAAMDLSIAAF